MSNPRLRRSLSLLLLGCSSLLLAAENSPYFQRPESEEEKTWQEDKVEYPAPPKEANLLSIYLGETQKNRYWVDKLSVSVGQDGVVRYSLVVESATGTRGVTYEGIRCEKRELRRYAVLKGQDTWSRSRNEDWSRITESPGHRQHAVLYLQHFCPDGIVVQDTRSAIRNLERGGRFPGENPTAY